MLDRLWFCTFSLTSQEFKPIVRGTARDWPKVVQVSVDIHRGLTCVAAPVEAAVQSLNIIRRRNHIVRSRNPIFLTQMHKSQGRWRQSRHRIVGMRGAEVSTTVLVGDEIAQSFSSDAWRSIGVQVYMNTLVSDFSSCEIGDCATEAMANDDDLGRRILLCCFHERVQNPTPGFLPGVPEALVGCAAGTNISGNRDEVDIGEPITNRT